MATKSTPLKKPSVHLIGIGGIGTSALARWFLAQNWAVSGSNIEENGITLGLQKEGVKVKIGHKKSYLPSSPILVVYSRAVNRLNPELIEAQRRGLKVLSYPQAVGKLTKVYNTIAIAGAHGKSTTTALTGLILKKAGLDPTVIVGTNLKEFGGRNFRSGKSRFLVLEADEYQSAFLNYSPLYSIVTNIDIEHLDYYHNLADIKKSFLKFLSRIRNGGALVLNRDDKNLRSLRRRIERTAKSGKQKVIWYSIKDSSAGIIKRMIKISGRHNLSNALGAFTLAAKVLGIKRSVALKAIGVYRGSWRRMEFRGRCQMPDARCQMPVYDDYAHHPTEIKATLKAFREKFPRSPIVCIFQPHQAERLTRLFKEFQNVFDEADITLIIPIYQVVGRDKVNPKFTSETLVRAIQKKNPKKLIFYLKDLKNLKKSLKVLLASVHSPLSSPVIVMMGAGDIFKYTGELVKK